MQYKDGKIIQIIQEFSVLGNTYNLNGIDLINAVFFVREDRKKFRLLLPAEYKIITTGSNIDLVIEDGVLKNCISVQVGIDLNKLSDLYNPTGSPDIAVLKDKYNQLEKDMTNLWGYIKKQGVTSDVMNVDIVLPSIAEGETYIMRNGSIEATPLISAEDELQKLLDKLVQNSQGILDSYVDSLKTDIENQTKIFFDENKGEFLNEKEVRQEISYATGTEYKQNNIFGAELKSIVTGETYYYNTKPYMAIKAAYNGNGFIIPDNINFADVTNKNLNEEISKLKESYYVPINNLIGTFPISGWVDWVEIDPRASNILIVLEHAGNLIATFDVSLRVLKMVTGYQYHLNAGTTWSAIRLFNNKIQISSPTNGAGGAGTNYVKLADAFFYK